MATAMRGWSSALLSRGYGLGGLALALYVWLAPKTIVDGDNAELSTLSVLGGRAHPSGYPLYVLWLRALSWLPGASAAHTAAIATAILAAAAVVALHAACRAWGARPAAATLACAMFAASPLVLIEHTQAEVFALNALVVACVLWLAGAAGPLRGVRRAAGLGLVAGLGLANHLTCVFVAPVGLYGVYLAAREARAGLAIAAAIGALVLGLLPYIYIAIAPDTAMSWGASHSASDVLAHAMRRDYGTASFAANGDRVPAATSLAALATAVARAWFWIPGAIGLGMLAWGSVRAHAGTSRAAWIALAISWLVAGPLFVSRFNLVPAGLPFHMVQRFYLLPIALLVVPVAVGLDRLAGARVALARSSVGAVLGIVALPLLALPSLAATTAEHSPALEHAMLNTLRALPPNAALITSSDDFAFGVIYAQQIDGVRPDVIGVTWGMMDYDWYRARAAARGAIVTDGAADDPPSVRLATHLLATGHAVFVDNFQPRILDALPSYPFAGLHRVLSRGTALPGLDAIAAENAHAYAAFDLDYPQPGQDDGYPTTVHLRYAETWLILAKAYTDAGFPEAAAKARETARAVNVSP